MARNPKRTPGPIKRAAPIDRTQPLSRNIGLRAPDNGSPTGPAANLKGRGKRPSADKGQRHWRTTPSTYRTSATHDWRWSLTVTDLVAR